MQYHVGNKGQGGRRGAQRASSGSDPNPFQYGGSVGYYTDPNAQGLILCGQRWYAPAFGRWLSRDPIGYDGGDNLYAYCGENPVAGLDPTGCAGNEDEKDEESDTNEFIDGLIIIGEGIGKAGRAIGNGARSLFNRPRPAPEPPKWGPYNTVKSPPNVRPGAPFTPRQRTEMAKSQ